MAKSSVQTNYDKTVLIEREGSTHRWEERWVKKLTVKRRWLYLSWKEHWGNSLSSGLVPSHTIVQNTSCNIVPFSSSSGSYAMYKEPWNISVLIDGIYMQIFSKISYERIVRKKRGKADSVIEGLFDVNNCMFMLWMDTTLGRLRGLFSEILCDECSL